MPVVAAPKATHVATRALKTGGMLRCSLKEEEEDRHAHWAMVLVELSQSVKDDSAVLQQLQGRNGPQFQFLFMDRSAGAFGKHAAGWRQAVVGVL